MLIGLVVAWAGSAQGQVKLKVQGGSTGAAEFRSRATTGGILGKGEVIRAEVTHSEDRGSVAVVGLSRPQPDYGLGGWFQGGQGGVWGFATVIGDGYRIGVRGEAAGGSTANYGVRGISAGAGPTAAAYGVYGSATCSACDAYAVYAEGDLAYTGNLLDLSDLRFKESLAPLGDALPKLLQLEVVSYEHIQTEGVAHMHLPEGPQVGFVAQQVAEVLPDLVTEAVHPPAGDPLDRSPDAEPIRYQALKTIDLIPYLVRAIQEQQAQIEALEAELLPLRNRLAELEPGTGAEGAQIAAAL
jgi:hypothetical protein